ncbi:UNVERIFIED_ORG: hypothetical protein B2H93_16005 [Clostridium botulinum]
MEENKIKVYIKTDKNNCIININSSIFLKDTKDWICIDEGMGDKYALSQNNYFPKEKPLRDMRGRCNYKYVDCKVIELTDEEKEKLFPPILPQPNEQQVLNAKLLQDNAEMSIELEKQKQLNSQILLQLAGGNANV